MKSFLSFSCILIVFSCQQPDEPDRFSALFSGDLRILDLTYELHNNIPYWPGPETNPFRYDTLMAQPSGRPSLGSYCLPEHFGTHIDAPIHFADGVSSVNEIPVSRLFSPAVVVDVSAQCADNPDYLLTKEDLLSWESINGAIPSGAVVLMKTGWGKRWGSNEQYRNADEDGKMHFPGFGPGSVRFLVDERDINGIGIDNLSVDAGLAEGFPAHLITNGANKFHLENVANLDQLPPVGAYLIIAPIKIRGGSGGQARIFGVLPD